GVTVRADARVPDAATTGEGSQGGPVALIRRAQVAPGVHEDQAALELQIAGAAAAAVTVEVGAQLAPAQRECRQHQPGPEPGPQSPSTSANHQDLRGPTLSADAPARSCRGCN